MCGNLGKTTEFQSFSLSAGGLVRRSSLDQFFLLSEKTLKLSLLHYFLALNTNLNEFYSGQYALKL